MSTAISGAKSDGNDVEEVEEVEGMKAARWIRKWQTAMRVQCIGDVTSLPHELVGVISAYSASSMIWYVSAHCCLAYDEPPQAYQDDHTMFDMLEAWQRRSSDSAYSKFGNDRYDTRWLTWCERALQTFNSLPTDEERDAVDVVTWFTTEFIRLNYCCHEHVHITQVLPGPNFVLPTSPMLVSELLSAPEQLDWYADDAFSDVPVDKSTIIVSRPPSRFCQFSQLGHKLA